MDDDINQYSNDAEDQNDTDSELKYSSIDANKGKSVLIILFKQYYCFT